MTDRPLSLLVALLVLPLSGCSSCMQSAGQTSFGIMPGVVNDPGNRTLRRSILRYGLDQFCKELTHRGAPLKLREEDPVMGRFFARSCGYQELSNGDAFVQFTGVGYAWTNVSLRIGFEATGSIQYNQDFLMHGSTMYAYFRTRTVASTSFKTLMVERAGVNGADVLGRFTDPVAQQVVDKQLSRGFTVIRESNGTVEFGLGIIEKGQHPARPFEVRGKDRVTFANERTEVHGQQLDFLGPFQVESNDRALYVNLVIDGVPAVDAMVVGKEAGDAWLEQYIRNAGVPAIPQPPLTSEVVPIRAQWSKTLPVGKGYYYVVVDNSSSVGSVAPPSAGRIPLLPGTLAPADPAALVNVVVQVGDAP